jgi:hypothetical protein
LHHTRDAPWAVACRTRASRTAAPAPLPRAAGAVAMPRTRQAPGSPSGATNPTAISAPRSKTPTANAPEGSCVARRSTGSCALRTAWRSGRVSGSEISRTTTPDMLPMLRPRSSQPRGPRSRARLFRRRSVARRLADPAGHDSLRPLGLRRRFRVRSGLLRSSVEGPTVPAHDLLARGRLRAARARSCRGRPGLCARRSFEVRSGFHLGPVHLLWVARRSVGLRCSRSMMRAAVCACAL